MRTMMNSIIRAPSQLVVSLVMLNPSVNGHGMFLALNSGSLLNQGWLVCAGDPVEICTYLI